MRWPSHGANPQLLYEHAGISMPSDILDFSVNTNPFGFPMDLNEQLSILQTAISNYPDPNVTGLKRRIASMNRLSVNEVLIGNGGSECIFLIAQYFQGKNVGIVEPTFGEYYKASAVYRCKVESYLLSEASHWQLQFEEMKEFIERNDVIFICHPNNPTGTTYPQDTLEQIINYAEKNGTTIVLDEAFHDFSVEHIQMISQLQSYSNLVILRSLTKMYNIPGVRLGYILANSTLINQLQPFQPPWSVNGLAQTLGLIALENKQFVKETRESIKDERTKLMRWFMEHDFYVSPSVVNYFIVRDMRSKSTTDEIIRFMLKNGIVPRHTYNFNGLNGGYLRLAVKTSEENKQLTDVLARWRRGC